METGHSPVAKNSPDRLTLAAFAVVVGIGGVNFVAVRYSNQELPPFWGAAVRFAIASLLLFGLTFLRRLPLPRGRALVGAVLYGTLSFGAAYAFVYWGLLRVPAGLASMIMATTPLITFLFAFAQGQEAFRWRGMVGALLAVGGTAVIFGGPIKGAVPLLSMLAIVATAACAAQASVLVKRFPTSHPITMNAVGMATGAVILVAVSILFQEKWTIPSEASTWAALAHLIFLGSCLIFVLFVFIIQRWTASATSYQFVLFPLVAVALSAWLQGEPLTLALGLGGLLILAGVYVGALAPTQAKSVQSLAKE